MRFVLGHDLYLSVEAADKILAMLLPADRLSKWRQLPYDDREICLFQASLRLNTLRWRGRPVSATQGLSWPRHIKGSVVDTPEGVLRAAALEAAAFGAPEGPSTEAMVYQLRRAGMTSYSIDDFSVTLNEDERLTELEKSLTSEVARLLVLPWLVGVPTKGVHPIK